MFPAGVFNQIPMGFQYPGQQPPVSLYPSQYGGFTPQIQTPFQQVPPPPPPSTRGQSLPASGRQYPLSNGPYGPVSSRRNGQYPPPASSQNYEYHNHGSKSSKKHHKQRSVSPEGAADQSLYSDKERDDRSRSSSGGLESQSKEEGGEEHNNDQEQQSHTGESVSDEISQGGTIAPDGQQNIQEKEKRRSRSKKKKHHRHEQYNNQYQQYPPPPFYPDLPSQMRVHQQPLYNGYNQVYDESIRRGDVLHKQAKRSTRLPPETKQQLSPHEDDHQKQYQFSGYPQQPFRPPFNPYQPYASQQGFFPQLTPYNAPQPWPNVGGINHGPADHEIQRLRSHIHTLEGELHRLQKKLNKASINHDDDNQTNQRSPRQTPVIVELNNGETNRESSSKKKHRHRNGSSQQGQNLVQKSGENNADQTTSNQQQIDSGERSRSAGNQLSETESKTPSKTTRVETAAQLAHAAAAHVNGRQQVPPPPPVQQQYVYQQGGFPPQSQQIRGPAPRFPVVGNVRYPTDLQQQHNFNQSNNNELVVDDDDEERRNRRSADKILDAFERFYMKKTATTPMKVKYIPEENNSNHQRNTNNNNNYRDRSISRRSLSLASN